MSNFTQKFGLGSRTRQILSYILYIAFFVLVGQQFIEVKDPNGKIAFGVILIFSLIFIIIYEATRLLYIAATLDLIDRCDAEAGLKKIERLRKIDLLRTYKMSVRIFKLLALNDLGRPREVLDLLNKWGIGPFNTSYEHLLIYFHSYYTAYIALDQPDNAMKYYPKIMEMQGKKQKRKAVAPLFAWSDVTAAYWLLKGNSREGRRELRLVNVDNLNTREKVWHRMISAQLNLLGERIEDAAADLDFVIQNGNKMAAVIKAKELKQEHGLS